MSSAKGLLVYRSPLVRDSDPAYQPIAELLEYPHEEVIKERVPDPNMMFGEADLTVYLIHSAEREGAA